jgi:hypothetical protein
MAFHELAKCAAIALLSSQDELVVSFRFSCTTFWVGRLGTPRIQRSRDATIRGRPPRPHEGQLGGSAGGPDGSAGFGGASRP